MPNHFAITSLRFGKKANQCRYVICLELKEALDLRGGKKLILSVTEAPPVVTKAWFTLVR